MRFLEWLEAVFQLIVLPAIYVRLLLFFGVHVGYGWMFIANFFILAAISKK